MSKLTEQFKSARMKGVPLLAIETPDQGATISQLVQALNGDKKHAALTWDIVRGPMAGNEQGMEVLKKICPNEGAQMDLINPTNMLARAAELPDKSCLFIYNSQRFYGNEAVAQAIWNLRDPFKATGRMLVLLAPAHALPSEIERDVILTDEPLPTDAELSTIIDGIYDNAGLKHAKDDLKASLVRAARGLAPFPAEQAVALSLSKEGANVSKLWELKRKMIEQTKGLSFYTSGECFDDIGGIQRIKRFGSLLFKGAMPPSCIVFVDEIDKAMAGAKSDTSGTSQDQHGTLLAAMEDQQWKGMILVGPPGCAKSMYAKALAATFGVPCIKLDMGAIKGSLVGQSEQQIRACMKVILAVAGDSAYWVATCNKLDTMSPEMLRRFTDGYWYFDLPDSEERESIWKVLRPKYKIPADDIQPDDQDWTGADIRNVCSIAYRLQIPLVEASTYITPVSKSDPDSIERLRKLADGSFLSASYPGPYKKQMSGGSSSGRKVSL